MPTVRGVWKNQMEIRHGTHDTCTSTSRYCTEKRHEPMLRIGPVPRLHRAPAAGAGPPHRPATHGHPWQAGSAAIDQQRDAARRPHARNAGTNLRGLRRQEGTEFSSGSAAVEPAVRMAFARRSADPLAPRHGRGVTPRGKR
jgi:hypothetical protein